MTEFCLVAGESSGDQLGADLIQALGRRTGATEFTGVAGPLMQAAGCEAWWPSDRLAYFGLFEVLKEVPGLMRMRRQLLARIMDQQPAALIGIDAPDFNLGLERKARAAGISTCHYVSPSVWAWRSHRIRKIAASVDLMLCLFPFEESFYQDAGVNARFVGHPMADVIPAENDPSSALGQLGLDPGHSGPVIALLPGSRGGEIQRHGPILADAAQRLAKDHPDARFLVALASESQRQALSMPDSVEARVFCGQARTVMAAADVVVLASGTATLEAMLVNRPQVVIYRLNPATHALARMINLVKTEHVALPNILAGESLVPELVQQQAQPETIRDAVNHWLDRPNHVEQLKSRFAALRQSLQGGGSQAAADAIAELVS